MATFMKYFSGSVIFTLFALAFSAGVGAYQGGVALAMAYLISAAILGVLETSVSLDNAVVNAKYLEKMNARSIHWFLTWGMVIAVFGMRLALPILIVCLAAGVGPIEAINLALFHSKEYQDHIESVHLEIMGFGAGFLFIVFLDYFFDEEKDTHWIPGLEHFAAFVGKFPQVNILLSVPLAILAGYFAPHDGVKFGLAILAGMVSYFFIHSVKQLLEEKQEHDEEASVGTAVATKVVSAVADTRLMVGSLVFLEILDASFSFDGVIAAFAVTNNFLVIAAGLGIGAMFVRSLTIYLVDMKTMSELKYLEHSAMWGIGWLVSAMVASAYGHELGEVVVAGVAALIIAIGGAHSYFLRKKEMA